MSVFSLHALFLAGFEGLGVEHGDGLDQKQQNPTTSTEFI